MRKKWIANHNSPHPFKRHRWYLQCNMHQLKNSNWKYIHTGLNLKSNICRPWKWARNWRNPCCRDCKLWPQQVVMSHSTETTSKGSTHLIDAKTDLQRCIKLHIRLHLNTSYGCSSFPQLWWLKISTCTLFYSCTWNPFFTLQIQSFPLLSFPCGATDFITANL